MTQLISPTKSEFTTNKFKFNIKDESDPVSYSINNSNSGSGSGNVSANNKQIVSSSFTDYNRHEDSSRFLSPNSYNAPFNVGINNNQKEIKEEKEEEIPMNSKPQDFYKETQSRLTYSTSGLNFAYTIQNKDKQVEQSSLYSYKNYSSHINKEHIHNPSNSSLSQSPELNKKANSHSLMNKQDPLNNNNYSNNKDYTYEPRGERNSNHNYYDQNNERALQDNQYQFANDEEFENAHVHDYNNNENQNRIGVSGENERESLKNKIEHYLNNTQYGGNANADYFNSVNNTNYNSYSKKAYGKFTNINYI